mmetsp:Transcript_23362/g.55498  ORF Transcript_23362/g.55498 Transcript_23362/m.55498 type:complete len:1308 (+) Transcript_23362:390-4313(+)
MRGDHLAFLAELVVGVQQLGALHLFVQDVVRVTRVGDGHATQHLANDHLDVLVVDLHALESVHVLDFVDDVARQFLDAQQAQDVLRVGRAVDDQFAAVHDLAFVHQDVLFLGHQFLVGLAVRIGDLQADLTLGLLAERHRAGLLGQHADILGRTGFEQLGHTRQTAGDVTGLLAFHRDAGEHFTRQQFLAVADLDQRADLEANGHRVIGARDLDLVALRVQQLDLRAHHLGSAAALRVDHDQRRQTGHFVDLLGHGDALLDVLELRHAGEFRDDRAGQRVPVREHRAGLDGLARLDVEHRAIRHLVAFALAAVRVGDDDFTGTGNHDQLALAVGHVTHRGVEADDAVRLGFDARRHRRTRRGTTDVEGPHRQLRARLADRLGGDDADGLTDVDQAATAEIAAIALGAQAEARAAGQRRADLDLVDTGLLQHVEGVLVEHVAGGQQRGLSLGVDDIDRGDAAEDAVTQRFDDFTAFDQGTHVHAVVGAAVFFGHDQILRHVDQATRQVAGVRGLQRRIRQALAGAVGGDEVLQNVQALAEVRGDGRLDDGAVRLGHQAAHAGQLADLGGGAPRARVGHHVDRVEGLLIDGLAVAIKRLLDLQVVHHSLADLVTGLAPDVHDLVVTLAGGHETRDVLLLDLLDLLLGTLDQGVLLSGHQHVVDRDRDAGTRGQAEAALQQLVGQHDGFLQAALAEARVDETRDFLLLQRLVDIAEGQALGQDFRQQRTADGGVHELGLGHELARFLVLGPLGQAHADLGGDLDNTVLQRTDQLGDVREDQAFALAVGALAGGVVQAQHHVLRRDDGRFTRGREQHVVGGQHQRAGFHLRFDGQRHVNSHLVTVEVGVEGRADERMQLDGLAFDQHGLEGLDAEAVQGRGAVQQDRVLLDDLFEDVPDHRRAGFDFLLRGLDRRRDAHGFETAEDEGLEQLQRHQLGQAALVQLEGRADHDDRTAGVVDALAQQVLTEATALALDHVGQGLEGTLVGAGHGLATAAVVQQRVDGLLQHALFVAHDDLRGLQLQQTGQTVVAVDDATVEVVQVGGREAAAVQRHQRTQVRRQHGQHVQHHPVRLDAGLLEGLHDLQALGVLLDLELGAGHVVAQAIDLDVEVHLLQQLLDALGAHQRDELVAEFDALGVVVVLAHDRELLQRGHARVDDDIGFKVQHAFDVAQRHVEHQAQTRRQALQEPDVRAGRGQVDVAHALAAHLGLGDFDAALLADDAAVLQALVLAAQALVVLDRAEDLGAEQAIALRLEGPVVDGLGLLHFTERPAADLLRRCQADLDGIEMLIRRELLEQVQQTFHVFSPVPD